MSSRNINTVSSDVSTGPKMGFLSLGISQRFQPARLVVEDEHHIAPNFQGPGTSDGFFLAGTLW